MFNVSERSCSRRTEEQNVDCGILGPGLSVFTQSARPFGPITRAPDVSQKDLDMAQWFVLYNSPELEPFLEYVLSFLSLK